jgi:CBS domain containing-hemolysin-like protein
MVENEITLSLTKSQAVVVAFLVGEFYRFMVKEGVSEVVIGYVEVADLVDKLSKAVSGLKQS